MRTKTINLYKFDELSDEAKEKARDWFREGNDGENEWDYIREDAKEIGLEILSLDFNRPNKGRLLWDALEVAEEIIKNHGKDCETHKTALRYLEQLKKENDENLSEQREETEAEFLHDLLEDYRVMLDKEIEYQNSDEVVDENIMANEYEFTEDGKRA